MGVCRDGVRGICTYFADICSHGGIVAHFRKYTYLAVARQPAETLRSYCSQPAHVLAYKSKPQFELDENSKAAVLSVT